MTKRIKLFQVKSSQVAFNKIMASALSYKRNTKYSVIKKVTLL